MLGWVALGADEIVQVKGIFELKGFGLLRVHCMKAKISSFWYQ